MSQENVEIVRQAFAAYEAAVSAPNPQDAIRASIERFADPEIEWHTSSDLPDSGVYRGHDGVAALIQEWLNSFEDYRVDPEEFIGRGEYVVVPLVLRGRIPGSRESDQEVTLPRTHVYKVREGKVVEVREYPTLEQALEAAGLSG
jgi:ketosteroid isomerase-like protein